MYLQSKAQRTVGNSWVAQPREVRALEAENWQDGASAGGGADLQGLDIPSPSLGACASLRPLLAEEWNTQHSRLSSRLVSRERALPQPVRLCASPMDCSPPDSSDRGISQARILKWVAISSSRGFSRPQDRTSRVASQVAQW